MSTTFEQQHAALLTERANLEAERLLLVANINNLTQAQKDRVIAINTRLDQIASEIALLVKADTLPNFPTDALARKAAKEDLANKVILTVPPPPKGAYQIIHSTPESGDLISYMKLTQHLNPYGRYRKCDIDLENIMSVLGKDFDNSIGEALEFVKKLKQFIG